MDPTDDLDDDEAPSSGLHTILHDKDLLARIIVAVDRPHPQLVVVAGGHDLGRLIAVGPQITIGRAVGSEITLTDQGVSRRHAKLRAADDTRVFVSDLGSSNGTFVNGSRITGETQLNEGDLLQVGDVVFLLFYLGEPTARPEHESLDETGAITRRQLIAQLEGECASARTSDDAPSIVLVSVSRPFAANETIESIAVSESAALLQIVRAVHRAVQDETASIGRYRSDVLAILIPEMSELEATRFERWIRELRNMLGFEPGVRVAIGASRWKRGSDAAQMLREAECELHRDLAG